jgi:excisionase family DNA binding protein
MSDVTDQIQKMLTIEEVAELFNVSTRHVSNLVKRKALPQPIRLGRSVRFRLSDIRAILNPPPSSLF